MSLKSLLKDIAVNEGETETGIPGLSIFRKSRPYERVSTIVRPSVCFILQGKKTVYLGKEAIAYNEENYLIISAQMPIDSELKLASVEHPYLGLILDFDSGMLNKLLIEIEEFITWSDHPDTDKIITSCPFDDSVVQSVKRLISVLHNPLRRKLLGESLVREVFLSILTGKMGYVLRNCVMNHTRAHRMIPVIHHIEKNYTKSIKINDLAKYAGMSPSSLHHHFKKATSLSPIQFIKKLRLHDAYDRIVTGESIAEAAYQTGYESQPQFSREFKSYFGYVPSSVKLIHRE